MQINMQP